MKINKQKKKTLSIIVIVVLLALIGSGLTYAVINNRNADSSEKTDSINYDPPTQAEIDSSQDAKDRIIEDTKNEDKSQSGNNDTSTGSNSTSKKTVTVGISYADIRDGSLEIRAFTPSVISGAGTCTAVVTKGSQRITKETAAFIDAKSTICEPVYIPTSQLDTGTWNITVTFSSKTHTGTSGAMEVAI